MKKFILRYYFYSGFEMKCLHSSKWRMVILYFKYYDIIGLQLLYFQKRNS